MHYKLEQHQNVCYGCKHTKYLIVQRANELYQALTLRNSLPLVTNKMIKESKKYINKTWY